MANENLPTKKPSPTDLVEETSEGIFKSKLPLSKVSWYWYQKKNPNLDGHIEFIDENGSTTVKMFFQLKSSNRDITYHDCDVSFLNYCFKAAEPTFLVFVNIPQQKVFWEHITPAYIATILGIDDLRSFDQQTKRIHFSDDKIANGDITKIFDVCNEHNRGKESARRFAQDASIKGKAVSGQEPTLESIEQLISSNKEKIAETMQQIGGKQTVGADDFEGIQTKFLSLIEGVPEKAMLFYAHVYLLKPFFLDQRGETTRRNVLQLLEITPAQERYITEILINANLLERTGDLIYTTQTNEARIILNHFVENGRVDLAKVTELFAQ